MRFTDGEFDSGVGWVEGVGGADVEVVSVSYEAVVAPVGSQLALGACKAAGAHHEAQGAGPSVVAAAGVAGLQQQRGRDRGINPA